MITGVRAVALAAILAACGMPAAPDQAGGSGPNTLTEAERRAGWTLLFDGRAIDKWRGYGQRDVPPGWQAIDGTLTRVRPAVDLISADEYADFELALEWKISSAGNSGIMFRVLESANPPYHTGPEMQVLDNAGHADGRGPETSAGSNYALHAPTRDTTRRVGEWNAVRLVVRGTHVEHWLNGEKVVEYELLSPDWEARVRRSKFNEWPTYGRQPSGHLVLQDHGDVVSYRSIKIRVWPGGVAPADPPSRSLAGTPMPRSVGAARSRGSLATHSSFGVLTPLTRRR